MIAWLTFGLTFATSVMLVVTGVFGLLAARAMTADDWRARVAWRLAGLGLLTHGTDKLIQNTWGGAVMFAGSRPAMATYLRWSQVFDHSRTFLMMSVLVGVAVLSLLARDPGRAFWRLALPALAAALAAGALVGVSQGAFTVSTHYTAVAVSDVVELLGLMAVLFLLLLRNNVDRYLWGLIAAYGCTIALGVLWFVVLAQWVAGRWQPPPWAMPLERLVFFGLMAALAWRRGALARRGRSVEGMLGRPIKVAVLR